jgi:hypothetical protein
VPTTPPPRAEFASVPTSLGNHLHSSDQLPVVKKGNDMIVPRPAGLLRHPVILAAIATAVVVTGTSGVSVATSSPAGPSACGTPAAAVPGNGTDFQTIWGDVDGDTLLDNVTLYKFQNAWHVNVTSTVTSKQSDTTIALDVDDTVSVSFEDIDHALGADVPPPVAIMALGRGPNADGIFGNFTFLTLKQDYCVAQWTYQGAPFQWVALQEPGHATGLMCEGAAGSIHYALVDSLQNPDGSWHVITRELGHDFTSATIEFLPEQDVPDSPDFLDQYGNIFNCGHAPLAAAPAPSPTTLPPPGAPTTVPPTAPPGGGAVPCQQPPAGATTVQTINGDVDGDQVDDTVTLLNAGGQWWVQATSSVRGWSSAARVSVNVDDAMSIGFFDFDYSLGAGPQAQAVRATGTGANSDGIIENFTFLSNTSGYCIGQWVYEGAPFQWVSLVEPGHVTDLCVEGAMGTQYKSLVDAVQNDDGTWHVIIRLLEHNFTTAVITGLSDEVVPADPDLGGAGSFCIS